MASLRTLLKKYCQALFFMGKGSTWAFSIIFPINGTNTWWLFLLEINSVTSDRNCFSGSCFVNNDCLNLSFCLATDTLSSYFQGCQMLLPLVPNVPFKFEQFSFLIHWQKRKKSLRCLKAPLSTLQAFSYHLVTLQT